MTTFARIILALVLLSASVFVAPAPAYACSDQSPAQEGCKPPSPRDVDENNEKDVEEDQPPVCKIGQPVIDGLTVSVPSESYDPEGSELSYYWFFGERDSDKIDGIGNPGSYSYAEEGTYHIRLKIFDDGINTAMCDTYVSFTVRQVHEPVCSFEVTEAEDGVFLLNSTATDADGVVEGYTWRVDEGDVFYGSSNSIKLEPGDHTIFHAVSDNEYYGAECKQVVTYTPQPEPDLESEASCDQAIEVGNDTQNNVQVCGDNNTVTVTTDPAATAQLEFLTGQIAQMRMELEANTGTQAYSQQQLDEVQTKLDTVLAQHEEQYWQLESIDTMVWNIWARLTKICIRIGMCKPITGKGKG